MTPRQIRSLLKVMEVGSVQRAARELYLAPSSISAQIRELSAELGVTLLEPAGRGIIPSAAAQQLQPSFRSFLALSEEISQQASSIAHEPGGTLKLFAPSSMCIYRLPALINALQASAPQVEVMLEHEPFDHLEAFRCGELDAAILVSQVESDEWINNRLHAEDVIFVCHPSRYQADAITLEQLNQQPLITTEAGCSYRVAAEVHFRSQGLTLKPRQSFSNVEVIRRCLLANMGIGLLPRCAVEDDLAKGTLKHQAVAGTPYPFFSTLVYPRGRSCPPKLQALIEVCRTGCTT
ncbi:LysR family transcriptional regulator [Nitrincola sp. MINF-07-Sa-05]|uniref:LysR family transcriptional regulator n=1 Tax=Nitrincola salilacus TaxID=3400273 RepID=UPI003917C5CB